MTKPSAISILIVENVQTPSFTFPKLATATVY